MYTNISDVGILIDMKNIFLSMVIAPVLVFSLENTKKSPQDEYNYILSAYKHEQWNDVVAHKDITLKEFPNSPFISDIYYFTGVAYFNSRDYDLANYYFSMFLQKHPTPKYFEDAIVYKFRIAEQFELGAKRHIMGSKSLPMWSSAYEDALSIYDDVIATIPSHDVAAKALFNKARMLAKDEKYKESIDHLRILIKRFPKHLLTPESYLAIAKVYLDEVRKDFVSIDFLDLASINLKQFKSYFPLDSRVEEVAELYKIMQDYYAKDLWWSAVYYDKKNKSKSAIVYYQAIVNKYPQSKYADDAAKRLSIINSKHS